MNNLTAAERFFSGGAKSTIEEATPDLRWRRGVLEQRWAIRHIAASGYVENLSNEWRPVPQSDEA